MEQENFKNVKTYMIDRFCALCLNKKKSFFYVFDVKELKKHVVFNNVLAALALQTRRRD